MAGVKIVWPVFGVALLVLFFPSRFFRPEKSAWRRIDHAPEGEPTSLFWWATLAFWLDVWAGFAGAFLLRQYAFQIETSTANATSPVMPLLAVYGILLVAVAVRMPVPRRSSVCMAPIALTAGMAWAVLPPMVSVVATVLAVCSAAAFRSFSAALAAGALSIAVTGVLLKAPSADVVLLAVVTAAPVVIGLLSYRALALPSRG